LIKDYKRHVMPYGGTERKGLESCANDK